MNNTKISLIIITKNRPDDLACCYESLEKLKEYPNEFILIDSSSDSQSKKLTHSFSKHVTFPVQYIYESRHGFPIARNRGLSLARYPWVAFTDDDCVVDANFISEIKNAIRKYPHAAAIAGESKSFYKNNLISHLAAVNENFWKYCARSGNQIKDLETLDNKNVAYNMKFFKKNSILYDDSRTEFEGASDDCDLGMQIQKAGGRGYYKNSMVVHHKDLTNILSYTKHLVKRTAAHATYEKKWHRYRSETKLNSANRGRFFPFVAQYIQSNHLSPVSGFVLMALVVYTLIIVRVVKYSYKLRS